MRIISGMWRGRRLVAPPGDATRPTSDRTREALFSMLVSRLGSFGGLRVADLFAGTGALGLEALSRGAAHCTFVEQDRAALAALKDNIETLGADAAIHAQSVLTFRGGPFDLILLDPPYGGSLAAGALSHLRDAAIAGPATLLSLETARDDLSAFDGYAIEAQRIHGKAKITLLRLE